MSTSSSIADIHVAHSEPHVSGMMRRINAMMDRGIKAIERRMAMEAEARKALRETQRRAQMKSGHREDAQVVELPPKKSKARKQLLAKVFAEISDRKINFAQAYRMYGVSRHHIISHCARIGVIAPVFGRGGSNGDVSRNIRALIDAGKRNHEIAEQLGTAKAYVRQIRKDYTGEADPREPKNTPAHEAIRDLYKAGKSIEEIQSETGSCRTYVIRIIGMYGWQSGRTRRAYK